MLGSNLFSNNESKEAFFDFVLLIKSSLLSLSSELFSEISTLVKNLTDSDLMLSRSFYKISKDSLLYSSLGSLPA